MKILNNKADYFLDVVLDVGLDKQLFSVWVLDLLVFKHNQVLNYEAKSSDWAGCNLFFVACWKLCIFGASLNHKFEVGLIRFSLQDCKLTLDDIFNWVEVANEGDGPRVTNENVDIGVCQHIWGKTNFKDLIARELIGSDNAVTLLVLNEVTKCLNNCCLQHWWNSDLVTWISDRKLKDACHEIDQLLHLVIRLKYLWKLFLVDDANDIEQLNSRVDFKPKLVLLYHLLPLVIIHFFNKMLV